MAHGVFGVVLAGCHADVIYAIGADWVFDSETGSLIMGSPASPPAAVVRAIDYTSDSACVSIELFNEILQCKRLHNFRDHHYKTKNLSKLARCFVVHLDAVRISGVETLSSRKKVAFSATIRHNGKKNDAGKVPQRAHRTVVLPRFQGLGIGSRLTDAVGEVVLRSGADFYGQTVHPAFGTHRDKSPLWQAGDYNHQWRAFKIENWKQRRDNIRIRLREPRFIYQHVYVGASSEEAAVHLAARLHVE